MTSSVCSGTRALDPEDGRFVVRSGKVLQRLQRKKHASAFSVFHNSQQPPIVIEQVVGVVGSQVFGFGGPIINQNIIRPGEIVTFQKNETAGNRPKTLLARFHR